MSAPHPIRRPRRAAFSFQEIFTTDPKSAAEIMYPDQQSDPGPGQWHIELRSLPIFHRGHAFLALVDSEGRTVRELHGLGHSKHTGEAMAMAEDGGDLKVVDYKRQADDDKKTDLGPKLKGTGPISNPGLSSFLQRTVAAGGSQALVASNKFKCSPTGECPECLSCSHTVHGFRNYDCRPEGDMLMQAYVGPGSTVRAMTYWRK